MSLSLQEVHLDYILLYEPVLTLFQEIFLQIKFFKTTALRQMTNDIMFPTKQSLEKNMRRQDST